PGWRSTRSGSSSRTRERGRADAFVNGARGGAGWRLRLLGVRRLRVVALGMNGKFRRPEPAPGALVALAAGRCLALADPLELLRRRNHGNLSRKGAATNRPEGGGGRWRSPPALSRRSIGRRCHKGPLSQGATEPRGPLSRERSA